MVYVAMRYNFRVACSFASYISMPLQLRNNTIEAIPVAPLSTKFALQHIITKLSPINDM